MSWIAVAIVGGSVLGGAIQANAAQGAANTQANAARDASSAQLAIYNQQRDDQEPWRQAGASALGDIQGNKFMDNWQQSDPGYQFRMDQGLKAVNAASSARGNSNSGATMKALTRYGQDYASNEYNNAYNRNFNRLSTLAGFGANANAQNNQAGSAYSTNYGNNVMGAANAQSAAQIAQGNAYAGAIGGGANGWMQYNMLNKLFDKGVTPRVVMGSNLGYLGANTNMGY